MFMYIKSYNFVLVYILHPKLLGLKSGEKDVLYMNNHRNNDWQNFI